MVKRNFNYNVGNIDYNLDGTRLVCKVAGKTGTDPLTIPSEATEVVDGTVTWSLLDDSIVEMSAPSSVYLTQSYSNVSAWTENTYIAPSDGYINVRTTASSISGTAIIAVSGPTIRQSNLVNSSSNCYTYMPVVGGQTITISRGKAHTNLIVYFFYSIASAKGLGLI